MTPAWIPCPGGCGEFWCTVHETHAWECICPPVEDWPLDPYSEGGPPQDGAAGDGLARFRGSQPPHTLLALAPRHVDGVADASAHIAAAELPGLLLLLGLDDDTDATGGVKFKRSRH